MITLRACVTTQITKQTHKHTQIHSLLMEPKKELSLGEVSDVVTQKQQAQMTCKMNHHWFHFPPSSLIIYV